MIGRFLYWWRANNRHGTHSPFIYAFLDQSYYAGDRKGLDPAQWLLQAAVLHFRPSRAGAEATTGPASRSTDSLLRLLPPGLLRQAAPPYDLYIFGSPGQALNEWLQEPSNYHNDTVVYVGGLRNPGGQPEWQRARELPEVRVSLENYYAGLLFFRREQTPEHFRIRN
ncbi:hypothetical protein [Robiginitalea sp. SC105]|uniref:hypothetical protein n=1 Tax=Robiginitalea sp. SC105 TaxID=2762332 RepID=UPI00163A0C4C|nr:hypothetical protein [Robiginitalea sp. SC105]MBC2840001.1 hypothetical protein [Robiginitalea sp. SC105]